MSTPVQIAGSVLIVLLAAATVAVYSTRTAETGAAADAEGQHLHGAPSGSGERNPVQLEEERGRRIGVTYATAELKPLTRVVRTVASVSFDEARVAKVSPRIHGWVERVHVDFLGFPVQRGQPLLELYSPELVIAQEELLLARGLLEGTREQPESRAYWNATRLLESARQRLDYWGIPADQVRLLEETGQPKRTLLLRAPTSGIVVEKNVFEGTHVSAGSVLYVVADLSNVWVEGEVFEKDLSLLELGQSAHVRIEAHPGETFHGRISYIHPTVSVASRTGRIRVELANPAGRLKPGMYAEIRIDVLARDHAVSVPRTAVIATGERDLVFVRASDGRLIAREVTLGLPAASEIEVLAGLEPGEVVVSSASFLIDAESNLGTAIQHLQGTDGGMDVTSPAAPAGEGHGLDGHGAGAGHEVRPNTGH